MYFLLNLMTETTQVAILAMMIACALPFVFALLAKVIGGFGNQDNQNPRVFLANLTGMAARANAAQQNSYESLPMFLASVLLAMNLFVPQLLINFFAMAYVVLRVFYGLAYLLNLATVRSILWGLSMACIFMLFYYAFRIVF